MSDEIVEILARAHYAACGADIAWEKLVHWRPHALNMMRATLTALNAAGYKVVPRDHSSEMLADGRIEVDGVLVDALPIWQAMWDSAP